MSDTTHPLTREEEIAKAGAGFGGSVGEPIPEPGRHHQWRYDRDCLRAVCQVCGAELWGFYGYIPPCPGAPRGGQ